MDFIKFWQIVETKQTIGEADNEKVRGRMESRAIDLGVILHKVIFLDDSPLFIRDILHSIRIFLRHILPSEKRTVLANSINLQYISAVQYNQISTHGFLIS